MKSEKEIQELMHKLNRKSQNKADNLKSALYEGQADALEKILNGDDPETVLQLASNKNQMYQGLIESGMATLPGMTEYVGEQSAYYDGMIVAVQKVADDDITHSERKVKLT